MKDDVKTKIHQMIDTITDDSVLQMVAKDIQYYTSNTDITDDLDAKQLQELEDAILEADNGDTSTWDDFKKEMDEWKKR